MDLIGSQKAVKDLIDGLTNQAIPEEQKVIAGAVLQLASVMLDVVDHATLSVVGIVADVANRAEGAVAPVDITISIKGQIGPLRLTRPDWEVPK